MRERRVGGFVRRIDFVPIEDRESQNRSPSAVAVVEALEVIGRRRGRRGGRGVGRILERPGRADAEAVAEEELLVFAIEVKDLEQFRAGFLDDPGAFGIGARGGAGVGGVAGLERGEAFVEAREEGAFFLEEGRVGDALVLFQEAVFFEGELVEFVTKGLVMAKGFRGRHGRVRWWALARRRRSRTGRDRG